CDRAGVCFFFSSRRRHTRFSRDWSSDVCSSDLISRPASRGSSASVSDRWARPPPNSLVNRLLKWPFTSSNDFNRRSRPSRFSLRSEERREGKSVDLGGGSSMEHGEVLSLERNEP